MEQDFKEIARAVVVEVLELEPGVVGDGDDFFDDLGGDSLQKLSIIDAFERRIGIRFDESEGHLMNTVDSMARAASEHAKD
jgi:acyl carrier protein